MGIAEQILDEENYKNETPIFKTQSANDWIKEAEGKPIPKMLFDSLWHEGELCILFADTNVGKSILAVQIADISSKGKSEYLLNTSAPKQKVLYFDFELSEKQFQGRYSDNYRNPYQFDPNFLRVEINPDFIPTGKLEELLEEGIKIILISLGRLNQTTSAVKLFLLLCFR